MRWAVVFIILALAFTFVPSSTIAGHDLPIKQIQTAQTLTSIERNWTTNVILVDYDPLFINETAILATLPVKRGYNTETIPITYSIEYNLYYATDSYADSLRQLALEKSLVGADIGTKLNESALAIQRVNPNTPLRVFDERAGRSIDGYAVEDWLVENPFVPPPSFGYNFYLLNLSEFDAPDHSMEHWFDYHPMDPDTGVSQNWFRLEFDYSINPPIMMQYAGIGGRENVYALDPSADQWYLRWARIWWQDYISTEYGHWTKDLEDRTRELDLNTTAGVQFLNEYLRDYMHDIISCLLFPYQHSPAKYVASGELKVEVIHIDGNDGHSIDDFHWVTNAEMQRTHLEELLPFIDWHVSVSFLDSETSTFWNNTFWAFATVTTEGVTQVAGSSLMEHIYENVRPYRIATGPDNINVYGVVFIRKNMLMYYGDGTYTGLGLNGQDGGQTLVCKSMERYFHSDNVTPREGVSSMELHESMHAIGFSHTWQHEHYASDFSYSPLVYFGMHNGTSSFDRNWVQGTYLDQMEAELWNFFVFRQGYLSPEDPEKTFMAESRAIQAFANARALYNQMDWMGAYKELCSARDWSKRMIYSRTDETPPVIDSWGTTPPISNSTSFVYWAHVTDKSGLENVTLYARADGNMTHAYECSFENLNWSVSVPGVSYESNLTLWIVAWDWAMNSAEGGVMTAIVGTGAAFIEPYIPLIIVSGVAGTAVVLRIVSRRKP